MAIQLWDVDLSTSDSIRSVLLSAEALEQLIQQIHAREPVSVKVENPGHWRATTALIRGLEPSVGEPSVIRYVSPGAILELLLENGYRIQSSIAVSEANPDLTGPLSRAISGTSDEAAIVERQLELKLVEIDAEPIAPQVNAATNPIATIVDTYDNVGNRTVAPTTCPL